jgi:arsenate reductase
MQKINLNPNIKMKKVYHLSTCDTCQRIIKELGIGQEFDYQDIKTVKITSEQLDEMQQLAGSYEALFSKIARKYKELNLKDKNLTESDFRQYILEEYTFLKRPVFLIDKQIFIGNAPKTIQAVAAALKKP